MLTFERSKPLGNSASPATTPAASAPVAAVERTRPRDRQTEAVVSHIGRGKARVRADSDLYGPDGSLRGDQAQAPPKGEWQKNRLEARDAEVRRNEGAKGEAVSGPGYIWQMGPDGELYAIGTKAHLVRKKETDAPEGSQDSPDRALKRRLEDRDLLVRGHERAHINASGGLAEPTPEYETQLGPGGRSYAIGGSVNLTRTTDKSDPEKTRRHSWLLRQAALAPGAPSGQDQAVADRAATHITV